MDVINKFYSSVQTTVSQLSGVLPGNNVTREYEVLQQVATAGVGMHWKVYSGYKKSTKQEVSVFVFEKKVLDKLTKEDRESILHIVRRGVQQLTKIKHPRVLTVQHPLEESRDSLAFATEPVIASLQNVLEGTSFSTKLFEVEIIHGFQQLIDGLIFLHSDANIVHSNLCPQSILINKQRNWKIFGFDFAITKHSESDKINNLNAFSHSMSHPVFEYVAPERGSSDANIPENDIYSLGMLMFCIWCGRPAVLLDNYNAFRQFASQPSQLKLSVMDKIPNGLQSIIKDMLHPSPMCRPKLQELIQLQPFQDVGVKTLNYLDTLYQWDNLQKSKFYKGLLKIIPNLPPQVNLHTVISHLIKEFVNLPMVPFVLPNILLIAERSTQQEYTNYILPHLKPVFNITEPIQVHLILMQKIDMLLKLTPTDDIKLYIMPMLNRALESEMTELQELCLQVLPVIAPLVDYTTVKTSILPRTKRLCLKSSDISIKVKSLICIGKLLEHLDKWVFLSDVLPFLEQIQNREPAVIMAIIGIHKIALADPKLGIPTEVMATKCIPFLTPLCLENTLTVPQFNCISTMIKEMFQKVEKEQRKKLEQLRTINRDYSLSSNQQSVLSPAKPGTEVLDFWTPVEQNVTLEGEVSGISNTRNKTNPLVLNRQLATPTIDLNSNSVSQDISNINPPINYIYPTQPSFFGNNVNSMTSFSTTGNTKNQNSCSSDLISLTQQDILNFLK